MYKALSQKENIPNHAWRSTIYACAQSVISVSVLQPDQSSVFITLSPPTSMRAIPATPCIYCTTHSQRSVGTTATLRPHSSWSPNPNYLMCKLVPRLSKSEPINQYKVQVIYY